jgi:hypothetical protein
MGINGRTNMTELPRIFVGTMHTQEGDFQKCVEQVQKQEGVTVTHFIVSGQREKEAHNALWRAWRDAREAHDLFVKIDADTVLKSETTLAKIASVFKSNPRITGMQAPLDDYMTESYINGLNVFSPKVTFNDTQDELYCDSQVDVGHDLVIRGNDVPLTLVPAGLHCHHASEQQAFHYGLHRMLKGQHGNIQNVELAWHRHKDRVRAYALFGARLASRFIQNRKFNYVDHEFEAAYIDASSHYDEWIVLLSAGQKGQIT